MKKLNLLFLAALSAGLMISSCAREEDSCTGEPTVETPVPAGGNEFDPALAAELGADDYGMKRYVMAFLKKGPNQDQSPEEVQRLQRAHMDNIGKLAEQRKLIVAGPLWMTQIYGEFTFLT